MDTSLYYVFNDGTWGGGTSGYTFFLYPANAPAPVPNIWSQSEINATHEEDAEEADQEAVADLHEDADEAEEEDDS